MLRHGCTSAQTVLRRMFRFNFRGRSVVGAAKVEPNSTFTTALLPESNRRSHGTIYRLHHFTQVVLFKIKTENLEKALWTGYERRYLFWSKLLPYNSLVGTVHKCNVDIHKILVCDITMLI